VQVDTGKYLVFSEYVIKMMMMVVISALHGPKTPGPARPVEVHTNTGLAQ